MTSTPAVYTAHDVPDLINTLPTLFGFRPEESLVAVATYGPRRRFGFRLRVDVPDVEQVDQLGRLVAGHLRHQSADGAILIAVTRRQDVARELLDSVQDHLGEVRLVTRVRADGERYWTDEPGSHADGVTYETSDHHVSIVHAVAAGQEILPDRQALVDRFAPVAGERRRWLEHATAAVLDEVVPQVARAAPGDLAATGMRVIGPILDRAVADQPVTDGDLLRVAAWVSAVTVRDEVWGRITSETCHDLLRVLTQVSRVVVPPFEPAVLSLAGFAAWITGDGAQALIAVERALDADPDYSMAHCILELLERGVSPSLWSTFAAGEPASP